MKKKDLDSSKSKDEKDEDDSTQSQEPLPEFGHRFHTPFFSPQVYAIAEEAQTLSGIDKERAEISRQASLKRLGLGRERFDFLMSEASGLRFKRGDIVIIALLDDVSEMKPNEWCAVARTMEEADRICDNRFRGLSCYRRQIK